MKYNLTEVKQYDQGIKYKIHDRGNKYKYEYSIVAHILAHNNKICMEEF